LKGELERKNDATGYRQITDTDLLTRSCPPYCLTANNWLRSACRVRDISSSVLGRLNMVQQKSPSTPPEVIDSISRFLASPPEGTPEEIIEAFHVKGDKEYLPPKLFLETVEQAPVAISTTDPTARILYVNCAFEQLTGYRRNEVIGRNQSLLTSKSTLSVYQELWRAIQEQRVWQGSKETRPVVTAVASSSGGVINQHFGHAREFFLYEASMVDVRFASPARSTSTAVAAIPVVMPRLLCRRSSAPWRDAKRCSAPKLAMSPGECWKRLASSLMASRHDRLACQAQILGDCSVKPA
jgi:PAS domain-containing protein